MVDDRTPQHPEVFTRLIEALCLAKPATASEPFAVFHVGQTPVKIGNILKTLNSSPHPVAPRTGHIGDWGAIAQGRAGALDFNQAILLGGFGYPSIHASTMTETVSEGDRVYCPGSILEGGYRYELPLLSWENSGFAVRANEALFCPFVMTRDNGRLVPLVELHRHRMERYLNFRFQFEASMLIGHEDKLREGIGILLTAAIESGSRQFVNSVISHVIARDGRQINAPFEWNGTAFRAGNYILGDTANVADLALVALRAVDAPDSFFSRIAKMPPAFPIISTLALTLFASLFQSTQLAAADARLHVHWGARDMAGFPPERRGYLLESGTRRKLRKMSQLLVENCRWYAPLRILLLPAAIFMLAPVDRHPADYDLVSDLVEKSARVCGSNAIDLATMQKLVCVASLWLDANEGRLSSYFIRRFSARSGLFAVEGTTSHGLSILPDNMNALPINVSCALVGALHRAVRERGI